MIFITNLPICFLHFFVLMICVVPIIIAKIISNTIKYKIDKEIEKEAKEHERKSAEALKYALPNKSVYYIICKKRRK